jgi:hypothetical protein
MVLADLGAEVTRVARPERAAASGGSAALTSLGPVSGRGHATFFADLKDDSARREGRRATVLGPPFARTGEPVVELTIRYAVPDILRFVTRVET